MSIKISGKSPGKSPGSKKKENGAWCNIDQDLLIPGKFLPVFNKNCQVSGRQQAIQQCIHNFSLGCGFCYMDQLNAKVQLIKQSGICRLLCNDDCSYLHILAIHSVTRYMFIINDLININITFA